MREAAGTAKLTHHQLLVTSKSVGVDAEALDTEAKTHENRIPRPCKVVATDSADHRITNLITAIIVETSLEQLPTFIFACEGCNGLAGMCRSRVVRDDFALRSPLRHIARRVSGP